MKKYLLFILASAILVIVFNAWITPGLITSGDFWFSHSSMYANRPISLYAWDWGYSSGMGGFIGSLLWVYLNFGIAYTLLGSVLGLEWSSIERIFYLFPFLIFSTFSSYYVFKKIFNSSNYAVLCSLIFTLNTYILMMVGGGQVAGVGMAYSLLPLVVFQFLRTLNLANIKKTLYSTLLLNSLLTAGIFSVQFLYDIRIGYITLIASVIYLFVSAALNRSIRHVILALSFGFMIPLTLIGFLHAFWLLPTVFNYQSAFSDLGSGYISTDAVRFFSFAKLENTLSLLHPNWPENVFGKVSFMDATFLVLPLLAYSSLLFIQKKSQDAKYIIYFALLGIVGAFLGKGASEPFGEPYLWMFNTIPGFVMFRDPTKWYTLVAISYAVLIPFSISRIYELFKQRKILIFNFQFLNKLRFFNIQNLFLFLVVGYLLFLIRPALFGQLTGTLKPTQLPHEYVQLEQYLSNQNSFSRTLWVPSTQRFGYSSQKHPAVSARDLFDKYDNEELIAILSKEDSITFLQNAGVRYIILPYDSQQEIFLTDRKYNGKQYEQVRKALDAISWLKQTDTFGKIVVYEVPDPKNHFWIEGKEAALQHEFINPTKYTVTVKGVEKGDTLVFSESFDPDWVLLEKDEVVNSQRYQMSFNSFSLPKDGEYEVTIYYTPQKWVNAGVVVSGVSFIGVVGSIVFLLIKRRRNGY